MKLHHAGALALVGWYLFAPGLALAGDTETSVAWLAAQNEAIEVTDEYGAEITNLPGVSGIGPYTDQDGAVAIRINVSKVTPELEAIPPVLGGFVVVLDVEPRQFRPHRLPRQVEVLREGRSSEAAIFIRSAAPAPLSSAPLHR